jgi:hypothetical protein
MTNQTHQPGPGRSTSDSAFTALKKEIALAAREGVRAPSRCETVSHCPAASAHLAYSASTHAVAITGPTLGPATAPPAWCWRATLRVRRAPAGRREPPLILDDSDAGAPLQTTRRRKPQGRRPEGTTP